MKFTDANIGAPGRCNDASVFGRSMLADVVQHPIYARHRIIINNTTIQAHLIADSAFPLPATMMKPYPERIPMLPNQSSFNFRLSHCRCTVERAFGVLKNRFRCLFKNMEYNVDNAKMIVKATCILHNICVTAQDTVEIEWNTPEALYRKPSCNIQAGGSNGVREALIFFFLNNPLWLSMYTNVLWCSIYFNKWFRLLMNNLSIIW